MSKETLQKIALVLSLVLSLVLNALGGTGVIPPLGASSCPPAVVAPAQ